MAGSAAGAEPIASQRNSRIGLNRRLEARQGHPAAIAEKGEHFDRRGRSRRDESENNGEGKPPPRRLSPHAAANNATTGTRVRESGKRHGVSRVKESRPRHCSLFEYRIWNRVPPVGGRQPANPEESLQPVRQPREIHPQSGSRKPFGPLRAGCALPAASAAGRCRQVPPGRWRVASILAEPPPPQGNPQRCRQPCFPGELP